MGSKYQIGRPTQEVRLRNWPAGRVAQFKKAIELLEIQLNQTMAAQVDQGDKRVFNTRVPRVTGLSVRSGFKNFQIHFLEARGISNLLFYEIQKASTSNFANPTTYHIPQTDLTIATAQQREIVFFRVRCVTSQFEVGPWSATVRAVGSSSFRIAITRTASEEILLPPTVGVWQDVTSAVFEATSSNVCIHLHAGLHAISVANFPTHVNGTARDFLVEESIVIRLLKNGVVMPTGVLNCTALADATRTAPPSDYSRTEVVAVGTMVTAFERFNGDEGTITYTVQAQLLRDSFQLDSPSGTVSAIIDNFGVRVDALDIMEIITG